MRVFIRTDASLNIGTGHVMRCLTLAEELYRRGVCCKFICRALSGNLIELIRQRGFDVRVLSSEESIDTEDNALFQSFSPYLSWLGTDWITDARETWITLGDTPVDWLIVDHYALDIRWETMLKSRYRKLMVIDDLADRPHHCDILLDQTFGRDPEDYEPWVPAYCTLLCGSQYALLRPEFAALRQYSLERRKSPQLARLLITLGGVDKGNATGLVLEALKSSSLSAQCQITVVMGVNAPWLYEVCQQAKQMPWPTRVEVGVNNMARLMADSDLAIGAAGATSWERCCLGLPTIMLVLADNQRKVAQGLAQAGSVLVLQGPQQIVNRLPYLLNSLVVSSAQRLAMSRIAASIVDGRGVETVIHHLEC